jgi:DNA polymerase delta subunit 2
MSEFGEGMERVERVFRDYESLDQKFKVKGTVYTTQYSQVYNERTVEMKGSLEMLTKQKWGDLPLATRIIDTEGEAGQAVEWAIIGVLFKEMKLRYSVLDQFVGTSTAIAAKDTEKVICSDSDTLLLEDASGRVALGGPLVDSELNNLVSGVMVACRGCVDRGGVLQVTDMITYGDGYTNKPPGSSSSWSAVLGPRSNSSNSSNSMEVDSSEDTQEAEDDAYVMLVSGLEVGGRRSQEEMQANGESGDVDLARQMLLDYLSGRLGGEEEVKKSSRIARLVVAGNSIDIPPIDAEAVATSYGPARTKIEKDYQAKST